MAKTEDDGVKPLIQCLESKACRLSCGRHHGVWRMPKGSEQWRVSSTQHSLGEMTLLSSP